MSQMPVPGCGFIFPVLTVEPEHVGVKISRLLDAFYRNGYVVDVLYLQNPSKSLQTLAFSMQGHYNFSNGVYA